MEKLLLQASNPSNILEMAGNYDGEKWYYRRNGAVDIVTANEQVVHFF